FEYKATAIGEAENEVKDILNKEYRDSMTIQDGLKMAFNALKRVLGKDFSIERIDGAYISMKDASLQRYTKEDFSKLNKA
ncbi:MAG: proteasome subunit alpha, partial [Nanoarchaeota archaeon]|nr:proteasome subunit alpha [Nanoarchaeota archaeon]